MSSYARSASDYRAAWAYLEAKTTVIASGYWPEVKFLSAARPNDISETSFLREAGWVVLSAGLSEVVVRQKFGAVSAAFLNWASADLISAHASQCAADALSHFANERKIRALVEVAHIVAKTGFSAFKAGLLKHPIQVIDALPYMGPATSRHLAKNIGLNVVKPDRHLVRMAAAAECSTADDLCQRIAAVVGDSVSVIDTVLWRYSTLGRDSLARFADNVRRWPEC